MGKSGWPLGSAPALAASAAVPCALAAAVALVYASTLTAPVFGDDRHFVEGAPLFLAAFPDFMRALLSRDYFIHTGEGTYQPLVTLFHYATHGHPAVHRACGLLIHAVNACLIHRLALRLEAPPASAILAAALFALFPAHAELLIISSFKGNLFALAFALSSLLCWATAVEKGSGRAVAGAFIFFVLALASKETGILIPGFLAGYSLLFARRRFPDLQRRAGLGFALVSACYLLWRLRVLEHGIDPPSPHSPSLLFGWYLKALAWPYPVCRERLAPEGAGWHAVTGLFLASAWAARRRPGILFGLLFLALGLTPFIYRAQAYMDSPVADRYLYLSAAGFVLALALAARAAAAKVALAALAVAWGGLTAQRNALYRDTRALYEQTVACAPRHFKAWGVLAEHQLGAGELESAQASARTAVTLNPYYPGGLMIWALASFRLGDYDQARDAVRLELALFPSDRAKQDLSDLEKYPSARR